ncbi:hypothetical protein EHS19_00100 [Bifidobacterium jacchi]|uniref:Uncharacterized protein n=2 Tax=Bifidobacterium jacchi TaxID=2490545 RepID=A0A5N5RN12_9BIFI|nr:hypothetical protein EHS19_00100 [Bifidobacterium jacchi]
MTYPYQFFHSGQGRPLPSDDGFINVELSHKPVPYHIARCFSGEVDSEQSQSLAMSSCRISCMATDVVRGRLPSSMLHRTLSGACVRKLETMAMLLEKHMESYPDVRERFATLPAMPQTINGVFVSPNHVEMAVHLTIGAENHWTNLVLRRVGNRWVCVLADVG